MGVELLISGTRLFVLIAIHEIVAPLQLVASSRRTTCFTHRYNYQSIYLCLHVYIHIYDFTVRQSSFWSAYAIFLDQHPKGASL